MAHPARIVVFGSLNRDITVTVPRMPSSDETLRGDTIAEFCGGKGFNQAVAASRLGAQVDMIGAVGNDAAADALIAGLARNGVGHSNVARVTAPTGTAVITTDRRDVTIVILGGANDEVSETDADNARQLLETCDALILQGEVSSLASARAASITRAAGGVVVFSPAPVRDDAGVVLAHATHVVANRGEAAALSLEARGNVVVTLGSAGALVDGQLIPTFEAPLVVDPTGAGDAFTASFTVAIVEGHGIAEAARRGNAAGSWAVRFAGAEPSMPTRAQLEQVLARG